MRFRCRVIYLPGYVFYSVLFAEGKSSGQDECEWFFNKNG